MVEDRENRWQSAWLTPYLRAMEITRVKEAHRPWCIRWVERFAGFLEGKPLPLATRADVEAFTSSLRSDQGVEEWKIAKASDSLKLLLTAVYGKAWEIRSFPIFFRAAPGIAGQRGLWGAGCPIGDGVGGVPECHRQWRSSGNQEHRRISWRQQWLGPRGFAA